MAHCKFDPTIQTGCISELIALARAGKAGNGEIATAVTHASCFAGCAAALYLETVKPDADPTPPIFSGVSPLAADLIGEEQARAEQSLLDLNPAILGFAIDANQLAPIAIDGHLSLKPFQLIERQHRRIGRFFILAHVENKLELASHCLFRDMLNIGGFAAMLC